MVKRNIFVIVLFLVLLCGVLLEQNFIDSSLSYLKQESAALCLEIKDNNENSIIKTKKMKKYWEEKEFVLSLFVDYKEIEQIGKEIEMIEGYLEIKDFDLALVESNLLNHILKTYHQTVNFDWQNII